MEYMLSFFVDGDRQRFSTVVTAEDAEDAIAVLKRVQKGKKLKIHSAMPYSASQV